MGVCLAIIVVCSKISIPIGTIPLTLQTFALFVCSLILGIKAFFVFLLYILLGLIGLPVFSSGGGFSYIYMPSFGFVIGFLPSSAIIGLASKSEKKYLKYVLSFVGLLVLNIFGVVYMYFILNLYMDASTSLLYVLQVAVLPFIIKDIIIMVLSCIIYSRIKVIIN